MFAECLWSLCSDNSTSVSPYLPLLLVSWKNTGSKFGIIKLIVPTDKQAFLSLTFPVPLRNATARSKPTGWQHLPADKLSLFARLCELRVHSRLRLSEYYPYHLRDSLGATHMQRTSSEEEFVWGRSQMILKGQDTGDHLHAPEDRPPRDPQTSGLPTALSSPFTFFLSFPFIYV